MPTRFMLSARVVAPTLALVAALLLVPGSRARAEDEEAQTPSWAFDVLIMRVSSSPEIGRQACPWVTGQPVAGLDMAAATQKLASRGKTRMLLSQRVTAMEGRIADAKTQHMIPIRRFDTASSSKDRDVSNVRFDMLHEGCSVFLAPNTEVHGLTYKIDVKWLYWPTLTEMAPAGMTEWNGDHRMLESGETLILHAREEIEGKEGAEVAEIYAFITAVPIR